MPAVASLAGFLSDDLIPEADMKVPEHSERSLRSKFLRNSEDLFLRFSWCKRHVAFPLDY